MAETEADAVRGGLRKGREKWKHRKRARLATACLGSDARSRRRLLHGCVRYTFCRFKGSRRFAGCGSLRRDARRPSPAAPPPSPDPDTARNPRHTRLRGERSPSLSLSLSALRYSLSLSPKPYRTLPLLCFYACYFDTEYTPYIMRVCVCVYISIET